MEMIRRIIFVNLISDDQLLSAISLVIDIKLMPSPLTELLQSHSFGFSNKIDWNFSQLSSHSQLTDEYVLNHLRKPWDYERLLTNKNLTIGARLKIIDHILEKNIRLPKIHQEISEVELIKKLIDYQLVEVSKLRDNRYLTLDSILYLIEKEGVSFFSNKTISANHNPEVIKWLFKSEDSREYYCDWEEIAKNRYLDEECVNLYLEHYEIEEADHMAYMVSNPCLTEASIWRIFNSQRFKDEIYSYVIEQLLKQAAATPEMTFMCLNIYQENMIDQYRDGSGVVFYDMLERSSHKVALDKALINRLLKSPYVKHRWEKVLAHPAVTSKILLKFINRKYPLATITGKKLSKQGATLTPLTDDRITEDVMLSYVRTSNIVDVEVLRSLTELPEYTPGVIFELLLTNQLPQIKWKFIIVNGRLRLIAVVDEIDNLGKLLESEYLRYIHQIEFPNQVTSQMIRLIEDKGKIGLIDMEEITRNINVEEIINYPDLPWDSEMINLRTY